MSIDKEPFIKNSSRHFGFDYYKVYGYDNVPEKTKLGIYLWFWNFVITISEKFPEKK